MKILTEEKLFLLTLSANPDEYLIIHSNYYHAWFIAWNVTSHIFPPINRGPTMINAQRKGMIIEDMNIFYTADEHVMASMEDGKVVFS